MAVPIIVLWRNYDSSDTTKNDTYRADSVFPTIEELGWTREGYIPKEWNTSRDGTGTSYSLSDYPNNMGGTYYVIWQEDVPTPYIATDKELISIADAIRAKGGTSAQLAYPTEFISAIEAFPSSGDYTLQSKSVTPTKSQQNITPDSGYYGLNSVAVAAIPNTYQDVTSVTAVASHVLASDIFVNSAGQVITGTMTTLNSDYVTWSEWSEDSAWSDVDHTAYVYNLPVGYNSQQKSFFIDAEIRTVTPATSTQEIQASSFDLLQKVTVNPIPSNYGDTSTDTATASHILSGYKAHTKSGSSATQVTGTIPIYNGEIIVPINYSVTISLTNPRSASYFGSFTIYEMIDESTVGNAIGSIDSASGSTQVSVSADIYGIRTVLTGNGVWLFPNGITVTGDVNYVGSGDLGTSGPLDFSVDGDGTITINGIEWDF